jgi:rubrerythrin
MQMSQREQQNLEAPKVERVCPKCGYHWNPRKEDGRPVKCPQCFTRLKFGKNKIY